MGCTSSTEANGAKPVASKPDETPVLSTSVKARKFTDCYTIGEVLGQGSFSVVKTARNLVTNQKVAVKIVSRDKLHPKDIEAFLREVEILRTLDHPNIVKMVDFFEEPKLYFLVLEYVGGGELFDRLLEKAAYTEAEARDLATTMFQALQYVHGRGLVHRDIKPENILLVSRDNDVNLKLADFGFCVDASAISSGQTVGTPGYISPEVIERRPHGPPVDMWAMGVVLFMLLGGYPPFYEPDDNQKAVYRRILNAEYEFHPENWADISEDAKDLIRHLLVVNPQERYTVDQALNHRWIKKPREEFALVPLERAVLALKGLRASRAKQAQIIVNAVVDTVRHMSGTNLLGKPATLNDVAAHAIRQMSSTHLNDALIQAAKQRSSFNVKAKSGAGLSQIPGSSKIPGSGEKSRRNSAI